MSFPIFAIIPSAGLGARAGLGKNKLLAEIGGETVIEKTVGVFLSVPEIDKIVVAASEEDEQEFRRMFAKESRVSIVRGGATRTQSVRNALDAIDGGVVLIHDGARPFVTASLIRECIACAKEHGSAIAAVPPVDTLAIIKGGFIEKTTREDILAVQTPQAFGTELIKRAYLSAKEDEVFTDDAGVFTEYVAPARPVRGEESNKKLTYRSDFSAISSFRVGTGFDLHKLTEGRKLILGGVEIPHDKGLLGHSDADVLAHAIMDALLSAASLRDIGYHFPDTDPKYKGISSMILFGEVMKLVRAEGYRVNNVSATIMAEKPKLMKFVPEMTKNIAAAAGVPEKDVGIGCTTLEGLGIVGREEGIAVQAYCSLIKV